MLILCPAPFVVTPRYGSSKSLKPTTKNPGLSVCEVDDKSRLNDFLTLPHRVYADDPHWVAPLTLERREALKPGQPVFEHLSWQGWVAYRDGQPVGRITAQGPITLKAH